MCALLFSLSHEKIRQKHQLVLKLCLFMWFWPGHAQIRNWSHIPRNVRNLQNLILIVFYIYPAFQNAINHLVTIYGSKVMGKSLEVVSFRVCTLSRNGVVYSKVVYCHFSEIYSRKKAFFKFCTIFMEWHKIGVNAK